MKIALQPLHSLFNNALLRRCAVAMRVPICLLAIALVCTQIKQPFFFYGLGVSLFGALAQLWCFACLNKNRILSANGPYSLVRNPMYLSRFFLILGGLIQTGNPLLIAVFCVIYYFYMVNRVEREEQKLLGLLGAPYAEYCRQVNRFLPALHPLKGTTLWYANRAYLYRNHGLRNIIAVILYYSVAWVYKFLY